MTAENKTLEGPAIDCRRILESMQVEERFRQRHVVGELEQLAMRNPYVRAHLQAWRAGAFSSFEQMLVALVLDLLQMNEQLQKVRRVELMQSSPPLVTPKEPRA
jgi:hypothetical protein